MASISPRVCSLVLGSLAVLGCQRLELAEDDSSAFTLDGSTSGTGTSTTDADDEESGSAEAADGTTPTLDCDPVRQTGCNESEKCTVVIVQGALTYTCVTDPGELEPNESCQSSPSGIDGCQAGSACIDDELDAGLCVGLCLDTADCTSAVCIPDPIEHIPYCADECSPFEGGCPPPLQCRRDTDRFACKFSRADDVGGQNEPCSATGDAGCGEGFVCIIGSLVPDCVDDFCCTGVCDTTDDTCDSPSTCVPLLSGPAPGYETIGGCLVPS